MGDAVSKTPGALRWPRSRCDTRSYSSGPDESPTARLTGIEEGLGSLFNVGLRNTTSTIAFLAPLEGDEDLKSLGLEDVMQLDGLALEKTPITDEGLAYLERFPGCGATRGGLLRGA